MSKLMIVESPAKAKTINKYLGDDFIVVASFGHVVDLPSKPGSVLPDEDFKMIYEVSARSQKHLDAIFKAAKHTNEVFIATDPDREGEAIAWHLADLLNENIKKPKYTQIKRVTFNEITKASVQAGIKAARDINNDLVNAQKARRALDYLVGFTLSPVLWRKLPGCKSAGRVQSVALRLICERDNLIASFKKEEYWDLIAFFDAISKNNTNKKANNKFAAKLVKINNKRLNKFDIPKAEDALLIKNQLDKCEFFIKDINKKQQQKNPVPPFITSTLQQEASRKINFGAKKTMQVAQKLYEGVNINGKETGLITYMRTDGVYISKDALVDIRKYIKNEIGEEYLNPTTREYASKIKNAQEAHEAIRPVDINLTPAYVKQFIALDEYKLYDIIWKRTIASQMSSVIFDITNIIIDGILHDKENLEFELKAVGSTIIFDGFYKIYKENQDEEDQSQDNKDEQKNNEHNEKEDSQKLPILEKEDTLKIITIDSKQHFTEPPARFTEASLVKELEGLGIGRPSTYASIISVLQERGYVHIDKKKFIPDSRGSILSIFLTNFFHLYVEYSFTANLENELDLISEGKLNYKVFLHKFWEGFVQKVNEALQLKITEVIEILDSMLEETLFPTKESRQCKMCQETIANQLINPKENNKIHPDYKLENTNLTLDINNSKTNKNKKTKTKIEADESENQISQPGELSLKLGKFGAFIACSNYPICKYTEQILSNTNEKEENTTNSNNITNNENKELGFIDNKPLVLKLGRFGRYIELETDTGLKRASIPMSMKEVSFEYAKNLISFPKNIGKINIENKEEDIFICIGKFGPYIKIGKKNIRIPKGLDHIKITLQDVLNMQNDNKL